MHKRSDFTKPAYKTAEVMKILNVSYDTIRRYDKTGKLPIRAVSIIIGSSQHRQTIHCNRQM